MDYKEKYENGLECIQEILSGAGDLIRISTLRKRLQPFFPELQENKDDRIRKGLIKAVSDILKGNTLYGTDVTREEALTWLEKQGEKKPADKPNFKIGDFIVNDYCKGKIIELTNDAYLLDTGQGIPFSCEHNIHLWTIEDAKNGDVLINWNNTTFIFKAIENKTVKFHIAYNEKLNTIATPLTKLSHQGLAEPEFEFHPATKEQCDILFAKMKETGYEWDTDKKELKKIEQKPAESTKDYNDIDPHFGIPAEDLMSTDKAESKFKVGNWYQCTKDFFGKGVTFDKNTAYYCAKEGCLLNGCHIAIVEDLYDNFKLWTIQDAKDGDVLTCPSNLGDRLVVFIFKQLVNHMSEIDCHCCIDANGIFDPCLNDCCYVGDVDCADYIPATKEQRDLLFQKMKEVGYEWDSEKKELKKIESKTLDVWNAEDEQNLNVVLSFIPDECLRRWLQDKLCYDTLDADDILPYLGNNQVQDILEDMGMLDDNGRCPHTAEEIFKAGMEHAFNLNREAVSKCKN